MYVAFPAVIICMETPVHQMRMKKWLTACLSSRTLAQYSTDRYAGGLYCRVRNGTGCDSAAMAVMPIQGILDKYITLVGWLLINGMIMGYNTIDG